MKIHSKREKDQKVKESLFSPGGTLAGFKSMRYDRGKYKDSVIGRELGPELAHYLTEDRPGNLVWAERRKDKDGPYWALFCFDMPRR